MLGDVPPSPRCRKVLEKSAEEAKKMGHEYIGTRALTACMQQRKRRLYNTVSGRAGDNDRHDAGSGEYC